MKRKIKILRILNRFNVGGPVYNATYLTKYLNSDLYETLLIGGKPEKHEKPMHNPQGYPFFFILCGASRSMHDGWPECWREIVYCIVRCVAYCDIHYTG